MVSPSATFSGPVTRFLALLAATRRQWDLAAAHFAAAWQAAERQNAPPVQAIIRLDEAIMLSSRGAPGDRERALELLEQGSQAAPEQMLLVHERIDALADELREGRSGHAAQTITAP